MYASLIIVGFIIDNIFFFKLMKLLYVDTLLVLLMIE